ncbi:hypothetical protein HDV03_004831 [Kappamyces sp. JEL0829]|nr:hypothetical protein HDV03_004831 [Kappamyces sp. JEL0829]
MPKIDRKNTKQQNLSQWQFLDHEFLNTPSVKEDRYSVAKEACIRLKACRMMERVGKVLQMPLDQLCVAKVLLHRVYMRVSLKKVDYHEIVAALLFMAGKLGSGVNFIKIEHLVKAVAYDCAKDNAQLKARLELHEGGKDYNMWSKRIFSYEELVLEKLCFDDHAILPHSFALDVVKEFGGTY